MYNRNILLSREGFYKEIQFKDFRSKIIVVKSFSLILFNIYIKIKYLNDFYKNYKMATLICKVIVS